MENLDSTKRESCSDELLLSGVIQEDSELLYLDSYLSELFR